MLASVPFLALYLRCIPPAILIVGSSPTVIIALALLRVVTLPLPRALFWRAEERLYSAYQAMISFFFESWSGVEVASFVLGARGSKSATVELYFILQFCYYGDTLPQDPENVLYISNHQCSGEWRSFEPSPFSVGNPCCRVPAVDWVIPEILCVKQGGYGGRARYILKDAIKFIPLYGWVLGEVG